MKNTAQHYQKKLPLTENTKMMMKEETERVRSRKSRKHHGDDEG